MKDSQVTGLGYTVRLTTGQHKESLENYIRDVLVVENDYQ